jgi:hypothetical protein
MNKLAFALLGMVGCATGYSPTDDPESPDMGEELVVEPAPDLAGAFGGSDAMLSPESACATAVSTVTLAELDVIVVLDHSHSMKPEEKYPPVAMGLKSFLASPKNARLSASLHFFSGGGDDLECRTTMVDRFAKPDVALTPLPDPGTFGQKLTAEIYTPFDAGTPTSAAIRGALKYATQIKKPDRQQVMVLATDGMPRSCGGMTEALVALDEAAKKMKVYIIGVGGSLNLDEMAQHGGTGTASMVTVGDPVKTATEFAAVLSKVRGDVQSCDFDIPPPSVGSLDLGQVNVLAKTSTGTQTINKTDCADGTGWHFNDPNNPTRVALCLKSCDGVRFDASVKIEVLFGCQTVVY